MGQWLSLSASSPEPLTSGHDDCTQSWQLPVCESAPDWYGLCTQFQLLWEGGWGVPALIGRCCVHSSSSFDLEEQSSKQEDFKYLGGVESNYGSLDKKINARIYKASQTLGCLRVRVLVQHDIGPSTKLKVGHGSVITKLSHRYETWTLESFTPIVSK